MSNKSRQCAEKIVQIAKQNSTRKTNLLVYERQNTGRCIPQPPPAYVPPIANVQAKRIKICTGAELKKMCAPPPCPCKPPPPSPTFLQRLWRLLRFGLKCLIAYGAIYITNDLGIWDDSDSTRKLYISWCEFLGFHPETHQDRMISGSCEAERDLFGMYKQDPLCCDKFPVDSERTIYEWQQKWNRKVVSTFGKLSRVPTKIMDFWDKKIVCTFVTRESCEPKVEVDKEAAAASLDDCIPCDGEDDEC